jgi:glycosyltransferase involved in cell wall biosynthesis
MHFLWQNRCAKTMKSEPWTVTTLIAHEWIEEVGGAENVLEQMRLALPHSRSVCLWNDDPARFPDVEETWLAASPLHGRKAVAMPFMGSAWNRVDLTDVDRVVTSSHAFSHHLASRAAASEIPAFAYVHSPARYVWVPDVDSRGNSLAGRLGRSYFRRWDRRHTSADVRYAANSNYVAQRIADVWDKEARVIYPPVDVDRIRSYVPEDFGAEDAIIGTLPAEFVLGASRLVPYKNLDAAISAGEILGLPVVLAGAGPDEQRLRTVAESARVPVIFTGRVSDDVLIELYRRAALFVYMPIEDFGIMPVEAMACGTPALVNGVGGARESVLATGGGTTAIWRDSRFADPTVVDKAVGLDMTAARSAVTMFSNIAFRDNLLSWLDTSN